MRKATFLLAGLAVFAALSSGQSDDDYKAVMKQVPPTVTAVRNAADSAAAKADATKLADLFDKMATFWKMKKADDAVKFAETARDEAKAIAEGTGDKAAHLMTIQGTCRGCHMAHREGTAPDFKIK